jgi:replicative DNA helicase Mcm
MMTLRDVDVPERWLHFLQDNSDVIPDEENRGILQLSLPQLDRADIDLTNHLIDEPGKCLLALKDVLKKEYRIENVEIIISTSEDSMLEAATLEELPARQIGTLVKMEGVVTDSSGIRYRSIQDSFVCKKCGAIIKIGQHGEKVQEPKTCPTDQGGCGRQSTFRRVEVDSEYRKLQFLLIRDYSGKQLGSTKVQIFDSLTPIFPGERVKVLGILKGQRKKKSTEAYPYIRALGVSGLSRIHLLDFTSEESKKAEQLSSSSHLWDTLIQSTAPSVYGYEEIKKAILLQQLGGTWREKPDGTTERGCIHVLLVGDPGSAKSQLLKSAYSIAPISQMATGKGASGVGLTAAVKRGVFDESWTLQAGAVVLANDGICIVDEFDKMHDTEKGNLHPVMSDGILPINKAGINEILPARTTILAGMNPRKGRFGDYDGIVEQIGIKDDALLSRFDLIYAIRDKVDADRDREICVHMGESLTHESTTPLSPDFLKKYFYHARQISPQWTPSLTEYLTDNIVSLRQQKTGLHISFRHWHTLRRLAEAFARARLSTKVIKKDVDEAIRVFHEHLSSLGIDLDIVSTGISDDEWNAYHQVLPLLPASRNEILSQGISEDMLEKLMNMKLLEEVYGKMYAVKK